MPGHFFRVALVTALALGAIALTRWTISESTSSVEPEWKPVIPPSLSEDFIRRLVAQESEDTHYKSSAPDLNQTKILWPSHGMLNLSAAVYRGYESVIFRVEGSDELLVKFQADCDEIGRFVNPLLNDYWFGKQAVGTGPGVFFLSAPSPMYQSVITSYFTMKSDDLETCVKQGGSVRFMVLAVIPDAMDLRYLREQFPSHAVPFARAMEIGIKLIRELRRLHLTAKVVHGDIHLGNILYDSRRNLHIIDFGRSRSNEFRFSNEPLHKYGRWYHQGFSHWQIEGFEWSMRDDVFNAIRSIAIMINRDEYLMFEQRLASQWGLMEWKKNGFIFTLPKTEIERLVSPLVVDPISSLPVSESRRKEIRNALQRVLDSVRSLQDINQVPFYDNIIRDLESCRFLAS